MTRVYGLGLRVQGMGKVCLHSTVGEAVDRGYDFFNCVLGG